MSCECVNCKRDNILNGTITADCVSCSTKITATTQFQIMIDKSIVCDECIKKDYFLCIRCQKPHKKADAKEVSRINDKVELEKVLVCDRCYTNNYRECMDCHGVFDRHDVMTHKEKVTCKPCWSKFYAICGNCNHTFPKDEVSYSIHGGNAKVCKKCFGVFGPIQRYETKPNMAFHGIPPHFMGIELECEVIDQNRDERGFKAQEVIELFKSDFIVLKEDGSISCGFEICTQPATLDQHKVLFKNFFDNLPKTLKSFNTSNCGLHVHCSKKPLSLLTIAKIVVFVNEDKNKSFIETIAGRKSNNYSSICKKEYNHVIKRGTNNRNDRYEAVNLLNKDTIEFRIFKGTLKKESFYKALEFCDAIIRFCMVANNGISYCRDLNNFIDFVAKSQKTYPHLYAFICAKILRKKTKLTVAYNFNIEELNPMPAIISPEPNAQPPINNSETIVVPPIVTPIIVSTNATTTTTLG